MKKRTKILLAILSAAAISAGTFALAGCGSKSKQVYNETYYAEYQAYVDAKKKAKEDYLGYEEWLTLKLFEDANGGGNGADGTNGKDGAAWLTGTTAPAATDGKDGDFYLNTTNFTIYSKSNGVWTELGSIMGSSGVGEDGVGIDSVEYKDGKIVIHLTNGETKEVELPAQITHIHAYNDEEVFTLIEATEETDGLGYKVCTDPDCNHLELVIISKRYIITVKDYNGNLIEGVTVVINGAKAVTDENGIATVVGYGYKNDYIISVEGKDTDKLYRTGEDPRVEVVIVNEFDEQDAVFKNDPYPAIRNEGLYRIEVNTPTDFGEIGVQLEGTKIILCNDTDEYKNYKLTVSDEGAEVYTVTLQGAFQDEQENDLITSGDDGVGEVVVAPHKQVALNFKYSSMAFEQNGYNGGDTVVYTVAVEEAEMPEIGTETLRLEAEGNTEITLPAGKTDWVYYTWENTNGDISKINFSMTNVEIEFTAKEGMMMFFDKETPEYANDGEDIVLVTSTMPEIFPVSPENYMGEYLFRVRLTGGASQGKFTLNATADPGTLSNPFEFDLDSLTDGAIVTEEAGDGNGIFWLKVNVPKTAKYFVQQVNTAYVKIFDHKPNSNWDDSDYGDSDYGIGESNGAYLFIDLEAGEYYVCGNKPYEPMEIIFREYDAVKDKGLTADNPLELDEFELNGENEYTFTVNNTEGKYEKTYYSFKAPSKGSVSISGYDYIDDSDPTHPTNELYYHSVALVGATTNTKFAADADVVFSVTYQSYGPTEVTITITWTEDKTVDPTPGTDPEDPDTKPTKEDEQEHTFTVKDIDGTPLAGVVITIHDVKYVDEADGEVKTKDVVLTTTGESDGNLVSESFLPGNYEVTVSGAFADNDEYKLNGTVAVKSNQRNYDVVYTVKKDLTIKVVDSNGDEVSGVTVKIAAADFEASTSADGTVTLHYFPGTYAIVLEDYNEEEYLYTSVSTSSNSWNSADGLEVTLRNDYYTYNITVKGGGTTVLDGVEITLKANGVVYGTGTTEDGVATIKVFYTGVVSTLTYDVVLTAEQQELYGFAYDATKEIIKSGTPGEENVTIDLVEKVAYNITVLNTNGAAIEGVTVTFKSGNTTVGTAATNDRGIATVKLVPGTITVEFGNLPAGTNAPVITLAEGTTSQTVRLGVGDKAAAGATGNTNSDLSGDACAMVVGINALTNSDSLNYYKFSASSGTYTFKITDKSTTSYISYLRVGENDVLINNGNQKLVKYGVILGANRGIDKAYEVTLTFTGSAQVVIGYATGTTEGGEGQITIARVTTEPETPSTPSTPSAQPLTSGPNNVTLTDGEATAVYEVSQSYGNYLKLTWDDDDIEVTIGGQTITSGEEFMFGGMEVEIVITSKSRNTSSVTLTVEEVQPNGD